MINEIKPVFQHSNVVQVYMYSINKVALIVFHQSREKDYERVKIK